MRPLASIRALGVDARGHQRTDRSTYERLLVAIGLDAELVEAMVGDLAEEFTLRATRNGRILARVSLGLEVVRSAPHLITSVLRRGEPRARVRLAAALLAIGLMVTATLVAVLLRDGPPSRLLANVATDGIVINSVHAVQLEMRVLDKRDHPLASQGVQYQWISGAPITVTSQGVVTCTWDGEATVRASLGMIATDVAVLCRPVRELHASNWIDFVAGDLPRDLPFVAIGFDDRPVMQLRGAARVYDTSIAAIVGHTIRPRAVGQTMVHVDVGDRSAGMRVIVHERVRSLEGLRADQRFVAVPVRLERGDTLRWSLPKGAFWLKYLPRRPGEAPPTITLSGDAACSRGNGLRVYVIPLGEYGTYCMVRPGGATVNVGHGAFGAAVVEGSLALERINY